MKYSVILVAMIATWATGIMAKDGKVETSKNASANKAEPEKNATVKDKKGAERMAEMATILKKQDAESGGYKDGERGKGDHGSGPRPYQNQLDRLPERGHNADDKGR